MKPVFAVAQRGEAILTLTASPISETEYGSEWLRIFVESLQATMLERQGVGIAAPQVYVSKRVIIVASRPNARYPDAPFMEPVVMMNPEILSASDEQLWGEEGCLSVASQRGQVWRSESVKVRYFSLAGELREAEYSGFVARIVQHEIDHLNGILFTDYL